MAASHALCERFADFKYGELYKDLYEKLIKCSRILVNKVDSQNVHV